MTKIRNIPYGYRIRDGRLCINPLEADAVKEVFKRYQAGLSFQGIADILNQSSHPPYAVNGWNKHHVKRMLENGKYTGEAGYPVILSKEEYDCARALSDTRAFTKTPQGSTEDILWERFRCSACGGRMLRIGSPVSVGGIAHLRCDNTECAFRINTPKDEIDRTILHLMNRLITDTRKTPCGRYDQTPEALRLANEINRGIAKPDDPDATVQLILKGIGARYGGIQEPPRLPPQMQYTDDDNRLFELDWELFKGAVSHIYLTCECMGLTTISGYVIFIGKDEAECRQQ